MEDDDDDACEPDDDRVDDRSPDPVRAYRHSLGQFSHGRGRHLEPCVAAIVHAAFLLMDPADLVPLGADDDAARAYDEVAGPVWHRIVQEHVKAITLRLRGERDDSPPLNVGALALIVDEALCAHFGGESTIDPAFADIVHDQFGYDAADDLGTFTIAFSVARLIDLGIGSMAW